MHFSDRLTTTEAYVELDGLDRVADIQLDLKEDLGEGFEVTNAPNPFNTSTEVLIRADNKGEAVLEVLSADGKLVLSRDIDLDQGLSTVTLGSDELIGPGVYFCVIRTSEHYHVHKVLLAGDY